MKKKSNKLYPLHLIFMVLAALLITSSPTLAGEGFSDIEIKKAVAMVAKEKNNPNFVILDVRTKREYDDGHLANSKNIDIRGANFNEEIGKLATDRTYLVYCRSGKRSKKAQGIMKELNFKKVINMKGGFIAWADGENSYER